MPGVTLERWVGWGDECRANESRGRLSGVLRWTRVLNDERDVMNDERRVLKVESCDVRCVDSYRLPRDTALGHPKHDSLLV